MKYIADDLNSINHQATLAVLLPIACAIGTKGVIKEIKEEILKENTLDAVFTLPNDIFHPGATVQSCCMVFKIGRKHSDIATPNTFFGYYKDDCTSQQKVDTFFIFYTLKTEHSTPYIVLVSNSLMSMQVFLH